MADSPSSTTFPDLPTEMKANVFAYVRQKSDQAAVCLVSREWKDIRAPILWETLMIAPEASSERLSTLLDPRSAITPHVRCLSIERGQNNFHSQCPTAFETVIQLIIGALPKDNLRTFISQLGISASLLLHLLQRQALLAEVDVRPIDFTNSGAIDFRAPTHAPWVLPSLTGIGSLTMTLSVHDAETYNTASFLTRNAPKLKVLNIEGAIEAPPPLVHPSGVGAFGGSYAGDSGVKIELSRITLAWLNLKAQSTYFTKYVDFSKLTSLQLVLCSNIVELIETLTSEFKRACNLTELHIRISPQLTPPERTTQAVEDLLKSFTGLKSLWLDLGGGRMVDVACIAGHGSSLRLLGVDTSLHATVKYLATADLAAVLQSAPSLEGLAVSICPISLGQVYRAGSGFKLGGARGDTRVSSELENYLDIIASHPTLKHLRLLTVPSIECPDDREAPSHDHNHSVKLHDDDVHATMTAMQHFATQVIS